MLAKVTFYAKKVIQKVDKAKRPALYRVAGMLRSEGKRTLKIRKGTSRPGAVPHAHTRGGLRVIHFNVYINGAIIGPVKFVGSRFFTTPVPGIHERGGVARTVTGWKRYPPRPFQKVTLARCRSKIPREFSAEVARYL